MQNLEQRINTVCSDRDHGSRWLVHESVSILRDLAREMPANADEQMRQLHHSGCTIARSRPAMAALASAVAQVLSAQGGAPAIAQAAQNLLDDYATATQRMAEHARSYVQGRVMTCSISGTVLDVLLACRQQIAEVFVLEGRPRYEGRAMAQSLSQQGIAVTLITDAQAAIFLPQCQCIVVGADSILANGDVLNKAGTALLAWAGQGYHIPFYVCCESLKIAPYAWSGNHLLEEKEPGEVLDQPIPGVRVRNFYFDHTPYNLVSKIITERGLLQQSSIQEIAATVKENVDDLLQKCP